MKNTCLSIIKGVVVAVIASLICVMAFAFILKTFSLSTTVVKPVNCAIKILVILLGCIFSVSKEKFLLKGIFIGVFATTIEYLIFGIIGNDTSFGAVFALDLLFGGIAGGISALVCMLVKKNN